MNLGSKLLIDSFDSIVNGTLEPKPQVGLGSYFGKKNAKYVIDWRKV